MKLVLVASLLFFSVMPIPKTFRVVQEPEAPVSVIRRYVVTSVREKSFRLQSTLREISGLAFTSDGRLFGHGDEIGVIYQIDPENGKVLKHFKLGKKPLRKDFEGIAIAHDRFFLASSEGALYEFSEGGHDESVDYKVLETDLSRENDVEGLCYDPDTHALLLACKGNPGKNFGEAKAVYAFSLVSMKLEGKPRFLLQPAELKKLLGINHFRPTGIARHPVSGSFFILSSLGPWVLEVSPSGKLVGRIRLSPTRHHQAEGIAVGPDLALYIADEGYLHGRLTRYGFSH